MLILKTGRDWDYFFYFSLSLKHMDLNWLKTGKMLCGDNNHILLSVPETMQDGIGEHLITWALELGITAATNPGRA